MPKSNDSFAFGDRRGPRRTTFHIFRTQTFVQTRSATVSHFANPEATTVTRMTTSMRAAPRREHRAISNIANCKSPLSGHTQRTHPTANNEESTRLSRFQDTQRCKPQKVHGTQAENTLSVRVRGLGESAMRHYARSQKQGVGGRRKAWPRGRSTG